MTGGRGTWAPIAMLWAGCALAGRPLVIDDAGTAGRGNVEVEAGVARARSGEADHWDVLGALTLGIAENLDIGAASGYQWEQARGGALGKDENTWNDLAIGAKWQFAKQDTALLDQALAFTAIIPLADADTGLGSGHPDYDLTWIGTRQITKAWAADVNVGYTYTTGSDRGEKIADLVHYGIATRYALSEQWEPVAEAFAETATDGGHETNVFGDIGMRYHPNKSIQLDAAIGTTLSGDGPDVFVTAGLTLYL